MKKQLIVYVILLLINEVLSIGQIDSVSFKQSCSNVYRRLNNEVINELAKSKYEYAINDGSFVKVKQVNFLKSIVDRELVREMPAMPSLVKDTASLTILSLIECPLWIAIQDSDAYMAEILHNHSLLWTFETKDDIVCFCDELYVTYRSHMVKGFVENIFNLLHKLKNDNRMIKMKLSNKDILTIWLDK